MEAHVKNVREILHSGDQFLVPFFQRQYSWTKKEWNNLYADVVALIEGGEEAKHFRRFIIFAARFSEEFVLGRTHLPPSHEPDTRSAA